VRALQRTVGNAAVWSALSSDERRPVGSGPTVQRDLSKPSKGLSNYTGTGWGAIRALVKSYNRVRLTGSLVQRTHLLDQITAAVFEGSAMDTGFRGLRHRDSRKAERAAAQTLMAEVNAERAALRVAQADLRKTFDGLQEEIWRQYIDLRRQHFGSAVFDKGLHGKPPEPGYLGSMGAAHKEAAGTLGERMTVTSYERLQARTRGHGGPEGAGWSAATDRVNASSAGAGPEFAGAYDRFSKARSREELQDRAAEAEALGVPLFGTIESLEFHPMLSNGTFKFAFTYGGKNEAASKERVHRLFDDFYGAVEDADDAGRLRLIAGLHKQLEYLHPFVDANTRTNLLVLNKLLVEYGFTPVVLDNPNLSYTQTTDEWAALIDKGMQRWAAATAASTGGLDVAKELADFDDTATTHAELRINDPAPTAEGLAGVEDMFRA
jgi:hypothetical protein